MTIGTDRPRVDATWRCGHSYSGTYWSRIADRRSGHISNFGRARHLMVDYNHHQSDEGWRERPDGLKPVASARAGREHASRYRLLEIAPSVLRVNLSGWPYPSMFTDLSYSSPVIRATDVTSKRETVGITDLSVKHVSLCVSSRVSREILVHISERALSVTRHCDYFRGIMSRALR